MIEYYEEVSVRGKKSGKCLCGKRIVRQTTFSQTINPFNKKDGRLKTRGEIIEELYIEREKWIKEPVHCNHPSYWKMTKEQREEYDTQGYIFIEMECGEKFKKEKPNNR